MINPFEVLEISPSLMPEQQEVERQYRKCIKQFHPDRFGWESDEQLAAIEKTSQINQAVNLLKNKMLLASFFLEEAGLLQDNEKMPQDFLMEMMDLNESIMEAEMENDEVAMAAKMNEIEQIEQQNESIFSQAAEAYDAQNKAIALKLLKDYYLKMKYILRLKERLINFAPR